MILVIGDRKVVKEIKYYIHAVSFMHIVCVQVGFHGNYNCIKTKEHKILSEKGSQKEKEE